MLDFVSGVGGEPARAEGEAADQVPTGGGWAAVGSCAIWAELPGSALPQSFPRGRGSKSGRGSGIAGCFARVSTRVSARPSES